MNGNLLRDAVISGANNLNNNRAYVDSLNVFPVPDGDTGTNMGMTITAARDELSLLDGADIGEVANVCASALLRGARGNSGVILSLLFRGFAKGLAGKKEADITELSAALAKGVRAAYRAVMKPTEGTMLTVAREASDVAEAAAKGTQDEAAVFQKFVDAAKTSLENTPNLLPVLKKAGVVDSGGMGLVKIYEGMLSVIKDGVMIEPNDKKDAAQAEGPAMTLNGEVVDVEFPYCTEFIVKKADAQEMAADLRPYLESIGNSVVFVNDDGIIKVHVHTKHPGEAIEAGLKYGSLINIKIDNMLEQVSKRSAKRIAEKAAENSSEKFAYVPVDPETPFGFVAVSAGDGLKEVFQDLGVNAVVSGGQTMNPSTDDIVAAIHSIPARTVFVLPNNKNIIMAAEQAVRLADRNVIVLPTRTIPEGLSAMLSFDPSENAEQNQMTMLKAVEGVTTGQVTYAARDSEFDGHRIKEGEMLAMVGSKLIYVERDLKKAVVKLAARIAGKNTSFMTIIYGEDVTDEQAHEIADAIQERLGSSIEYNVFRGGQPVYHFLLSAE